MVTVTNPMEQNAASREDLSTTLAEIQKALDGLHFGQVAITVHDGVVTQVERLERHRIAKRNPRRGH